MEKDKKLFVIISAGMDKGVVASRVAIEKGMAINDIVVIERDNPEDMKLLNEEANVIEMKPRSFAYEARPPIIDRPFYYDLPILKKCRAKDTTKTLAKRRAKNKQAKKSRARNRKK